MKHLKAAPEASKDDRCHFTDAYGPACYLRRTEENALETTKKFQTEQQEADNNCEVGARAPARVSLQGGSQGLKAGSP